MGDLARVQQISGTEKDANRYVADATPDHDSQGPSYTRPVWMEIDLEALRENYRALRLLIAPEVKVIASIKANAYGHGAIPVAHVLSGEGVDAFATGSFEDAVAIRQAGIRTKLILFACQLPDATERIIHHSIIPTVYNLETARAVSKAASTPTPVYIKVDGGLGRFGVQVEDAVGFVKAVASLPRVVVEGLYTHLPFDDEKGEMWARHQLGAFRELKRAISNAGISIPVTQALSSGGLVSSLNDGGCTAVCPGHLLYGLRPVSEDVADCSAFQPVLRAIKTRLIHKTRYRETRVLGMGGRQRLKGGSTVGVVPLGLVDGYRSARSGEAVMLIRGRRVPVIGVSLEASVLDLTGVPRPRLGEPVVALGQNQDENIRVDEMASWHDVSALEIVMAFDRRIPVRHVTGTRLTIKSADSPRRSAPKRSTPRSLY